MLPDEDCIIISSRVMHTPMGYKVTFLDTYTARVLVADGCKRDASQCLQELAESPNAVSPDGWDKARAQDVTLSHPELAKTALELSQFVDCDSTNCESRMQFAAAFEAKARIPAGCLQFVEEEASHRVAVYIGGLFLVSATGRDFRDAYNGWWEQLF